MATLEEFVTQETAAVEAAKPLNKNVDGVVSELSDAEYTQLINDRAKNLFNQQEFGYITARQEAYNSIADQLDMQYWDAVNGTTTWKDHIAQVKADNPKP
tara:strand:- start:229 stop:528 length:300 start_codon:yes stop_codon:yes gene_type:complete